MHASRTLSTTTILSTFQTAMGRSLDNDMPRPGTIDLLSVHAARLARGSENPGAPIRFDRVLQIRERLANGTYDTAERLDVASSDMARVLHSASDGLIPQVANSQFVCPTHKIPLIPGGCGGSGYCTSCMQHVRPVPLLA